MALMTKQTLVDICKQHKLYKTPALNDKLYLNFKGFTSIANLEEYTGLRALFLEGNALDSIEGLPELLELRCLYLQQNCIWQISHLEGVPNLDTLNVSNNALKRLDNLASACPKLATLIATDNQLETVDSIAHLAQCTALQTLDLKNNKIDDPEVLEVLKQLPNLKCLYLQGNPVVSHMKNYRKTMIAALPSLGYLDERPVFEDERRMVTAWVVGGLEAERAERKLIKEEKEEYDRRNFEAMQDIRRRGWSARRERLGLPPGDTDPALDDMSDEEYQFAEEPPELVEARKRLAAYTPREGEEEPAALSEARRQLAKEGGTLQPGVWSTAAESDGDVYLASVKSAQAELDVVSGRGTAAGAGAGALQAREDDSSDDGSPQRDTVAPPRRGPVGSKAPFMAASVVEAGTAVEAAADDDLPAADQSEVAVDLNELD